MTQWDQQQLAKLKAERIARVEKAMAKASRGPSYSPLGFMLLPSELRAAAVAAVEALEPELK